VSTRLAGDATRVPDTARQPLRSPFVAGLVAAVWAAAVGVALSVAVVALVWFASPHGDLSPVTLVRAGALVWLYANHATVHVGDSTLSLGALGLLLVPALLLYRCGRWAGRVSVEAFPAAAAATATTAAAYATAAGVVASATSERGSSVGVLSAVAWAAVLALVAAGCGVLAGARLWSVALPPGARPLLRGAAAGLAVLVCGGALVLAAALVGHLGRVADIGAALGAGDPGGVQLLVVGVLGVPTGVVWAASYAVGPGFAVGLGTAVAPSGVALGPVPALPLLGALPATGPAPGVSLLALVIPLAAGLVVGLLAARRPLPTPGATAAVALASGVLAGLALGLLAALSSGAFGAVRLSTVGPDALAVGLAAAVEVGAVAAAVAYEGARHRALLGRAAARVRALAHRR
jgi:hypothetical protein